MHTSHPDLHSHPCTARTLITVFYDADQHTSMACCREPALLAVLASALLPSVEAAAPATAARGSEPHGAAARGAHLSFHDAQALVLRVVQLSEKPLQPQQVALVGGYLRLAQASRGLLGLGDYRKVVEVAASSGLPLPLELLQHVYAETEQLMHAAVQPGAAEGRTGPAACVASMMWLLAQSPQRATLPPASWVVAATAVLSGFVSQLPALNYNGLARGALALFLPHCVQGMVVVAAATASSTAGLGEEESEAAGVRTALRELLREFYSSLQYKARHLGAHAVSTIAAELPALCGAPIRVKPAGGGPERVVALPPDMHPPAEFVRCLMDTALRATQPSPGGNGFVHPELLRPLIQLPLLPPAWIMVAGRSKGSDADGPAVSSAHITAVLPRAWLPAYVGAVRPALHAARPTTLAQLVAALTRLQVRRVCDLAVYDV